MRACVRGPPPRARAFLACRPTPPAVIFRRAAQRGRRGGTGGEATARHRRSGGDETGQSGLNRHERAGGGSSSSRASGISLAVGAQRGCLRPGRAACHLLLVAAGSDDVRLTRQEVSWHPTGEEVRSPGCRGLWWDSDKESTAPCPVSPRGRSAKLHLSWMEPRSPGRLPWANKWLWVSCSSKHRWRSGS